MAPPGSSLSPYRRRFIPLGRVPPEWVALGPCCEQGSPFLHPAGPPICCLLFLQNLCLATSPHVHQQCFPEEKVKHISSLFCCTTHLVGQDKGEALVALSFSHLLFPSSSYFPYLPPLYLTSSHLTFSMKGQPSVLPRGLPW